MKAAHLAMLLAWLIVASAPTHALDRRVDIFDTHAAGGLPSQFNLPTPANDGTQAIRLIGELRAHLDTGSGLGRMFLAEIDGRPGTIVRLGDTLDIALAEDDKDPPSASAGAPIDREYRRAGMPPLASRGKGATRKAAYTPALDVWIFLHETAGENDHAKFLNWYVGWWINDLEENVKLEVPIRVSLRDNVPGLTDMDYDAGTDVERIGEVARRGAEHLQAYGVATTPLTKYVLFVDRPPSNWASGTLGSAVPPYGAAIVSNRGHRHIFAHEVGHLLDATHELAERQFFCITNMMDNLIGAFSCKYYSEANNERIRRYVHDRSGR
ncbi:hypothetical protein [Luteibacter yeojuensis]|uniref:Reprolysin-like metallo-peptidase family M12B n=1 Tax=Luteibacter yeojuensis TaxID=345309 RepID=A0A7X5QXD6_9GAMM|nr:hypothetical protein [Luteibacter yeojuensis]NID17085.1 hypothetical protein [Luteibacter yeojuensis]